MRKRVRSKRLNHLLEVKGSVDYLKGLLAANQGLTLAILRKNLHYAILKEEELWKAGYGDLTNSSKTLQPQEETV
jgi:hypothetical protein